MRPDAAGPAVDGKRLAVARTSPGTRGASRTHVKSDLRVFLSWYAERGLEPLSAQRPQLELYVRCVQEGRRFKPSTVSRRVSVVPGFTATATRTTSSPPIGLRHVTHASAEKRMLGGGL